MLHEFIAIHREDIIRRCRAKVALRSVPPPTDAEMDHGVPVFLDQLAGTLRLGRTSSPEMGRSAVQHGKDLLLQGFTVSQVVHDYGDVCQAITELAVTMNAPISTEDFGTLNRCLDDAIADAVTEYGRARDQSTLDREVARGSERLGFFAHELRNMVNTALMAFEVLRTGNVGVTGSTGTVLHRTLMGLRALIARSLAEARLTQGVQTREQFPMSGFIEELARAARLEASARGIRLTVGPIDDEVAIEADRQVLAAVVGNLLQNACKFTRPHTTVTLRVGASAERVLIEIEDECGGLPAGNVDDLFRPFEQRSPDRSGVGLGLAFSRWGVEANSGRIHARDLPGKSLFSGSSDSVADQSKIPYLYEDAGSGITMAWQSGPQRPTTSIARSRACATSWRGPSRRAIKPSASGRGWRASGPAWSGSAIGCSASAIG